MPFSGKLIYVGPYQYKTVGGNSSTIQSYATYSPLTREQFSDALSKGFELMDYRLRRINPNEKEKYRGKCLVSRKDPHGKGVIWYIVKPVKIKGVDRLIRTWKEEADSKTGNRK